MKTVVSAMDFGTSKLVALVAEANGRERCDIIGAGTALYDGYLDGQWNAPSELNNAINNAIHEAEEQAKVRIRDINIGVPGDFCTVRAVEAKVDLQGADPHVTIKDIDELFQRATQALGEVRGQIIHRSPAWFMVDDGEKTLEPMNARGYELRAMISFVTWNSVSPSLRLLSHLCLPTYSTSYFCVMVKEGLTQMRVKPRSCWAYIPPIEVPTIKSGISS